MVFRCRLRSLPVTIRFVTLLLAFLFVSLTVPTALCQQQDERQDVYYEVNLEDSEEDKTDPVLLKAEDIRIPEPKRVAEYQRLNYTWPPLDTDYQPNTNGWRKLMRQRFEQIAEIDNRGDRYASYHNLVHAALLCPNFTEYGFGLARGPEQLTREMQRAIRNNMLLATSEHGELKVMGATSKFISQPRLVNKVLRVMQPYMEAWAGVPVKRYQAYGFRLYQNQSQLNMHCDRMTSHILSFIYHIDRSDDAESWPIFIEDFHGRTHEVTLTPGDVLFYESSKCLHGRPRPLNGSWYTSLFAHYHPLGWTDQTPNQQWTAHYRVPPIWDRLVPENEKIYPKLDIQSMSYLEPECQPSLWCNSMDEHNPNIVKWSGPAEHGVWIKPDADFSRIPLRIRAPQTQTNDPIKGEL